MAAPPVPSIRQQLLSSSLLAVLGGYGLLLGAHALFAAQERRHDHRVLITSVQQEILPLAARANGAEALSARLTQLVSPNLIVWIETEQGYPYRPPRQLGGFQLPQGTTLPQLLIRASLQQSSADHPAIVRAGERTYLLSATSLRLQGQPLRLQLLEDVTAKVAGERTTRLLLLLAAAIATLFTGLLLRPALARGLAPLRDLGRRMQAIGSESLERDQLPLDALPRELLPIAGEFNALLQRLAASWERQRSFVDGVAHELRTPITLISGHAQRLLRQPTTAADPSLRLIQQEAQRMGSLVTDLLDLARQDSGRLVLRRRPILADEALLQAYERLAPSSGWRLHLDATADDLPVALGDPERLQQCLAALIENASLRKHLADDVLLAVASNWGSPRTIKPGHGMIV